MGRNKHYLDCLLFTLLIIISANCTKSSKSSTPSGTILNTIDVGGQSGLFPGFLPANIVSDNNGSGAIWVSATRVIISQSGNVSGYNTSVIKYDLNGNVITYTAVFESSTTIPGGMALDKNSNLWMTSYVNAQYSTNELVEISSNGKIIQRIPLPQGITRIHADANGNIWVCIIPPTGYSRFIEVLPDGTIGTSFTTSNILFGPFAFDQSGHIWAANQGTGMVMEMDTKGNIINTFWGGPSVPGTMTIGDLKIDNSGNVWVTNYNGGGSMTQTGDTVTKIFTNLSQQPQDYVIDGKAPYGLAVDHNNNIWITGAISDSVTKMSNNEKILGVFRFDQFQEIIQYSGPGDITVDKNNNIWFTDDRAAGYVIKIAP